MFRRIGKLVTAGVALGVLEFCVVAVVDRALFLSAGELARYGLFSLCLLVSLVVALGLVGAVVAQKLGPSAGPRVLSVLGGGASVALYWALTSGRRVRDMPLRALWVALLAAATALLLWGGWRYLEPRLRGPRRRLWGGLVLALGAVALLADALVLRRLYGPFHLALAVLACGCAAFASLGLPSMLPPRLRGRGLSLYLLLLAVFTVGQWQGMQQAPNARFAVEQAAPISGKVLALSMRATQAVFGPMISARDTAGRGVARTPLVVGAADKVDLGERDVLLITVDALRADCLAAYGGTGLTPAMDALAQQGVVFERAYTTAPHTSYAIASLMTGKYMREVLALPGDTQPHATLAQTVRRYGYRTAAFYPPALFFVDEGAFADLSQEQFGFEYAKVMFAPAQARVEQLRTYLDGLQEEHALLVWVHLFEPHEPYEPAAQFARGDSPRERYDGEVAQADAAVGALVELFRARRGADALVVLTADHGEEFRDHGGYRHGTTLFDEQVRVPLVVAAPPTIAPGRSAVAVDHVDVPTTILSLLGMPREARMRGDDLSAVLAGTATPTLRAFASVEDQRMVTDGKHKLICHVGACRLFDLQADPRERRDIAATQAQLVQELSADLSGFAAGVAEQEAIGVQGQALPDVLSRVTLGDPAVGPELIPWLDDRRPRVRALAAAACGESGYRDAAERLRVLASQDADTSVQDEARLALYRLGELPAPEDEDEWLRAANGLDFIRRAALAMAERGDRRAREPLAGLAADRVADGVLRRRAIAALGQLEDPAAVAPLVPLLEDVRLRPHVAKSLGVLGTEPAREALLASLEKERYPESRAAAALALVELGERRVVPLLQRFLATESGLQGGLAWLERFSALAPVGGYIAAQPPHARRGFKCDQDVCVAGDAAQLELAALGGRSQRLVVEVQAQGDGAELQVQGQRRALQPGWQQVSFLLSAATTVVELEAADGLRLRRFAVLTPQEDIAPPAPEPWEPGDPPAAVDSQPETRAPVPTGDG